MSKKNKRNPFDSLIQEQSITDLNNSAIEKDIQTTQLENINTLDKIVESVSDIDKDNRISELLQEKDELESKIINYITENEQLRKDNSNLITKQNELHSLITNQSNQLSSLQNENDSYLLKISELTFELARLNSEQKLYKNKNIEKPNNQISKHVNYNHSNNGYGTWN